MGEFCLASIAKINRHKSHGFWMSQILLPTWMPSQEFKWAHDGTIFRCLCCQVGLHVNMDVLVAPLLLKLRRKLLLWDLVALSFGGHVLVANQVLLATIWYIASTLLFARSCILQCKVLSRIPFKEEKQHKTRHYWLLHDRMVGWGWWIRSHNVRLCSLNLCVELCCQCKVFGVSQWCIGCLLCVWQ